MKTVLMWEASQGLRGAWQLAIRLVWGQRDKGCALPLPCPAASPPVPQAGQGASRGGGALSPDPRTGRAPLPPRKQTLRV